MFIGTHARALDIAKRSTTYEGVTEEETIRGYVRGSSTLSKINYLRQQQYNVCKLIVIVLGSILLGNQLFMSLASWLLLGLVISQACESSYKRLLKIRTHWAQTHFIVILREIDWWSKSLVLKTMFALIQSVWWGGIVYFLHQQIRAPRSGPLGRSVIFLGVHPHLSEIARATENASECLKSPEARQSAPPRPRCRISWCYVYICTY